MGTAMLRLDKETKELEAALFPTTAIVTQEDTKEGEDGSIDDVQDTDLEKGGPSNESEPSQPEEGKEKRKYTDWKQRYVSLRSHHDALAFDLRKEVSELKSSLISTSRKIAELQTTADDHASKVDIFSQEERDLLGDETIAAMQKATSHAVTPLQEELKREKELRLAQLESSAQNDKASVQRNFLDRLGRLVPDYASIDNNPKFLEFMGGIEDYSGTLRKDLFKRAEANGDVARVAEFFMLFKQMVKGNSLESHITPTGSPGGGGGKQVTAFVVDTKFINDFYDDCIRGRFKGRSTEMKEIESKIDRAISEGRSRR